ncbi:hypothetical protein [Streptomyces malaysiensis]|uniref:hypothetical protein n=1 Tax=Streptomyces malaysiensis TaxID=92644 RepID=UPI00321FD4F6|nr:hypothetical protein [Streptomyces malaysiensis]
MAWAPTRPVPEPVGVIRTALVRTRARVPEAVVRRVMWRAAMVASSGMSMRFDGAWIRQTVVVSAIPRFTSGFSR